MESSNKSQCVLQRLDDAWPIGSELTCLTQYWILSAILNVPAHFVAISLEAVHSACDLRLETVQYKMMGFNLRKCLCAKPWQIRIVDYMEEMKEVFFLNKAGDQLNKNKPLNKQFNTPQYMTAEAQWA